MRATHKLLGVIGGVCLCFSACNRMATPPATQLLKDAESRVREGDFLEAISLYERALDGSPSSAETHYRLALLYDDKMRDPFNALHHFKRYLTLTPSGTRAEEVKKIMKRDELTLVTELSGDSVVSRAEAARLKNENLDLRQQIEQSRTQARTVATEKPSPRPRREKKTKRAAPR